MSTPKAERTAVANAAVMLSGMYQMSMRDVVVAGDTPRVPVLAEPAGPSTMGGAQARQHILLTPEEPSRETVTVGWVNIPERTAELRTFGCLREVFQRRHGDLPFVLFDSGYDNFFFRTKKFLESKSFKVTEVDTAPVLADLPEAPSGAPTPSGTVSTKWIAALIGLLVVVAVLGYLLAG